MNNAPLLSIIIPVYQAEKYLGQCIDSILHQDYPNIEVILIDDGSVDRGGEICNYYSQIDNRVVVYHQSNKGQGAARNKGIQIAKGDYITFVDADDSIEDDTYSGNIELLEKNKDVDILQYPITEHFGSFDQIIRRQPCFLKISGSENIFFSWMKDKRVTGYVCNKIIRKKILHGLAFREDIIFEDRYFECDLYRSISCIMISNIGMYRYYDRPGSTIRRERDSFYYRSVCIADKHLIDSICRIVGLSDIVRERKVLLYYYYLRLFQCGSLSELVNTEKLTDSDLSRPPVFHIINSRRLSKKDRLRCLFYNISL